MAEKFGKQVKIYYTNNKQTTSVTGIDASSYILFNGGSNHIYTHGKDFAADPSHTHKFLELSDVKDTFSKPADTTNTWVPVDVNGKIYHREIPAAYNQDPSTLSVNSANTANIANTANSLSATCAANDYIGIKGGGSNDNGYLEIYTGDNGNEPIYLRQYSYDSSVAIHTATLLDSNGNTSFPGTISSNGHTVLTNRIDPIISVACTSSGILTFTSNNNNKYEFNFNHTHDLSQLTGKIKVECLPDAALKDTTYSYSVTQSATNNNANPYLTLTPSNSGTVSNIQLAGGSKVTITRDSASKIIISSSWRPLGTGSNDAAAGNHTHGLLHYDLVKTIDNTTADSGWSMINETYNGAILKSLRTQGSAPNWIRGNYAAGIAFGSADTKGVLSVAYDSAASGFKIAGGNGSKPVWWMNIHGTSGKDYNLDAFAPSSHEHNYVLDSGNGQHTTFAYSKPELSKDSITWLAVWNGYELRGMNKDQIALAGHTHDSLDVDYADSTSFNAPYHDFQVLYAGGNNGIEGRPADVDAFGLLRFRVASGWSGQILFANGGDLYIRSAADNAFNKSLSWKRIIDSGNIKSQSVNYANSAGNSDTAVKLKDYNGSTNIYCGYAGDGLTSDNIGYMVGIQANENNIYYKDVSKSELQKWLGLDSYVASATKLQTPRTIWGQSFDGTANVSGDMTGVGSLIFSASEAHIGAGGSYSNPWGGLSVNFKFGGSAAFTQLYAKDSLSAQEGKFYTDSDGAYWTSDIRKKHDFSDITKDIVDKFFEKNYFKHFKWNDTNHDSWGVAAQEFEEWAPEAINTDEDGFKSANYDVAEAKAIAALTAKVKQQQEEINKLKQLINDKLY